MGNPTDIILNVEDHAPARFVRTRILERAGFRVEEADSAAAALSRSGDAALMLLDVRLPDGDGFEVCEQVKKLTPAMPVVMITSVYRTSQARRDGFAAGADAFLLEPAAPEQLVRTVEGLMRPRPGPGPQDEEAWAITDAAGLILELSGPAARLLNLTARGARGRSLPSHCTDNRTGLLGDLARAAEGTIIERVTTLQPRDRRSRRVRLDLSSLPTAPGERVQVHWSIVVDPS